MDVYLVLHYYYGDVDRIVGVFLTFDGARIAMLIRDPGLTEQVRHEIVSHEEEIWYFQNGSDLGSINRLPLSGFEPCSHAI